MFRTTFTALLFVTPMAALAAGGDSAAPATTGTTQQCSGGQVFDQKTKTCVNAQDSRLDDQTRLDAARELAFHDRPEDALIVLASLSVQTTPEVLTLKGFATRKAGDLEAGFDLYHQALALDPNHWQARSYMGQALAELGRKDEALAQLTLIRDAGGRGTWAETSLARAIETGRGYSH